MWSMHPGTLYRAYRDHISDYYPDIDTGKWKPAEILQVDQDTGEIQEEKPLYVFKPENFGSKMSIDDKQIGRDGFTILSNTDTGKIAMMIESTGCSEVEQALDLFGSDLQQVESISCDMSPTYLKACRNRFTQAQIVVDKFHVMQYVYDAVAEVRLRIKKELSEKLSKGRLKTEQDRDILSDMEQLRRSRHLLSQSPQKWSQTAIEMMQQLFVKHPQLKQAYDLAQQFKSWYDINNSQVERVWIEKDLFLWYEAVEKSKLGEFKSVVRMIEKHEREIINFFSHGHTNAKAERLNGKIQRFVSNNYGIKDKDFVLYRIAGYFS